MTGKKKTQGAEDKSGNWGGLRHNCKGSVPSIARKHILAAEKEAAEFLEKVHAAGGVSAATAFGMCMANAMATGNYALLLGVANSAAPYELPKRAPVDGKGDAASEITIRLFSPESAVDDPMNVGGALPAALVVKSIESHRPQPTVIPPEITPKAASDVEAVAIPANWSNDE